uniref:Uncharacterized protein n=1 Tax=Octopus bimaculoides TaxID=37653 RepID=A0A0L8HE31_OCTBM
MPGTSLHTVNNRVRTVMVFPGPDNVFLPKQCHGEPFHLARHSMLHSFHGGRKKTSR